MICPIIKKLDRDHKGDTVFGKLDVNGNYDTSSGFNIRSIPKILVFKNGGKVGDIIGAMPEDMLLGKINAYK